MDLKVSTRQHYSLQVDRMASVRATVDRLQAQIATGKKIIDPSDDPVGSARIAQLQRTMDDNSQFMRNIDALTSKLDVADGAVEGMSNSLTRVSELLLNAANGTLTSGDRRNIAAELDQIIAGMVALANTRDVGGDYVFAGTRSDAPAYITDMTGAIVFQGDGQPAKVAIGPDTAVSGGLRGDDILTPPGATRDVFAMLADFRELLDQPTPVTDDDRARYDALIGDFQKAIGHVNDTRAAIGGRLSTLDSEKERLTDVATTLTTTKTSLESADVAQAITEMQAALLVLKASQQSFAQISTLSLFDYIK